MKKTITSLVIGTALFVFAIPVFAGKPADTPDNGKSHRKATGSVGYTAAGLQRWGDFNAHELYQEIWDLTGTYDLALTCKSVCSGTYNHSMTVDSMDMDTGDFSGDGYYIPNNSYTWDVVGIVSGNDVDFTITYTGINSGYFVDFEGTIDPDGTISGTAKSSTGQTFDWETTSGLASASYNGKGMHHYSDANGRWYDFEVVYVRVDGDNAFYAGPIVAASNPGWLSNWASFAVLDDGTPGSAGDSIWGVFTNEMTAAHNTAGEILPGAEYPITSGNLVVH